MTSPIGAWWTLDATVDEAVDGEADGGCRLSSLRTAIFVRQHRAHAHAKCAADRKRHRHLLRQRSEQSGRQTNGRPPRRRSRSGAPARRSTSVRDRMPSTSPVIADTRSADDKHLLADEHEPGVKSPARNTSGNKATRTPRIGPSSRNTSARRSEGGSAHAGTPPNSSFSRGFSEDICIVLTFLLPCKLEFARDGAFDAIVDEPERAPGETRRRMPKHPPPAFASTRHRFTRPSKLPSAGARLSHLRCGSPACRSRACHGRSWSG